MDRLVLYRMLFTVLIVYILFGLYLFLAQGRMVYFPSKQDFSHCEGFEEYEKVEFKETRFYELQKNKDLVIFYHGNAGSACDRAFLKPLLEKSGKSVIVMEYAGYSNHNHRPSKKLILQDVKNIVEYTKQQQYQTITVLGESVGTGAAAYHSSISSNVRLFLLSPFTSMTDLAPWLFKVYPLKLLMTQNYDNREYLKNFRGEIFIIHGSEDTIIAPIISRNLFDSLATHQKQYHLVAGAGHNDLYSFEDTKVNISAFLSK